MSLLQHHMHHGKDYISFWVAKIAVADYQPSFHLAGWLTNCAWPNLLGLEAG